MISLSEEDVYLKGRFTVQRMLIYQNAVFLLGHAVSSMQAIWSCHNVVKEPICTLPWQSLALDQLKYLQIAVNWSTMKKKNLRWTTFNVGSVGIIPYFFLRLKYSSILLQVTLKCTSTLKYALRSLRYTLVGLLTDRINSGAPPAHEARAWTQPHS